MKKITFLGDIMCELPFLRAAARNEDGFIPAFADLQDLLVESDFVVANLETPVAGEELGYTKDLYAFNTPSIFLDALKNLKIDLYLTANNHCLDRGIKGLTNTLDELDKRGMLHTGTFRSQEEQSTIFTQDFDGTICSFLSYNAYVNEDKWQLYKKDLSPFHINQLIDMDALVQYRETKREKSIPFYKLRKKIKSLLPKRCDVYIRGKLGYKFKPYVDNEPLSEIKGDCFDRTLEAIKNAKQKSDLVFVLPHCGGQFNTTPGIRSREIFQSLLENDADAVVGSHPHAIQNIAFINDKPCVYSLGNVSMSPSSPYMVKSSLPEYGLVFHAYVEGKKIVKTSFSIIKAHELPKDTYPIISPVDKLTDDVHLEEDIKQLYKTITGSDSFPGIQREYPLTQPTNE